jgi:hypothetical protein
MESARHLCLLPYARPQHRELDPRGVAGEEFLNDLPSCCPDWSTYAWGDYFDIYNYGGFTADKMLDYDGSRQGDGILRLEGLHVDDVSVIGAMIPDMKVPPAKFVPIVETWLDMAKARGLSPRAVWELFHVATHKDVGLAKVALQAAYWSLLESLSNEDASYQEFLDAVIRGKHTVCHGSMEWLDKRAVFGTEPSQASSNGASEYRSQLQKGSIGMALPNVKQGDAIFIVKGRHASSDIISDKACHIRYPI